MTTRKDELKLEQAGLLSKLGDDLDSKERIQIRERLHAIDNELSALDKEQGRHYLFVRGYDKTTGQFDLRRNPTPIKADKYYAVFQKYVWRNINGKLERSHCTRDRMYKVKSGNKYFFLQSEQQRLLRQYVAHLGIDGVEVREVWSKKKAHAESKEDLKLHEDTARPLARIPRSGIILLEGRRIKSE